MNFAEQIKYLATTTELSNSQIANKLGCTNRTVRRHAGPYADRIQRILGIEPKDYKPDKAKILLLDVETAPLEVYVWSLKQRSGWIPPSNIKKDWSILTWSAKWLFDSEIYSSRVGEDDAFNRKDDSIMQDLWRLLNEANMVVAHNGTNFDVRRVNARLAINGYIPPYPYKIIDTMTMSKRQFDFSSFALDYMNSLFNIGRKEHPGFGVWKAAVEGGQKAEEALGIMRGYCDNDIRILEELYLQVRPWLKGHPNIGLYIGATGNVCDHCGNDNLDWGGKYFTAAGRFRSFRCGGCGGTGRDRISDLSKEERARLCVPIA